MPTPTTTTSPYYAMIRTTDTKFALRHNLVVHALQHGLHATARHFGCTRNTVRKWRRRYQQHRLQGLHAHSRAQHSCPHNSPRSRGRVRQTYATLAADRFLAHLAAHGVDLRAVEIRTDLGAEFDGDTVHVRSDGFIGTIEQQWGACHEFNPPHCPNANADVETVHSTIEGEFFDAQCFTNRADFFAKVATYQLWYNVARKNSSRGWRSPLE